MSSRIAPRTFASTDPHQLAYRFLKCHGRDAHGHLALRYWREEFWRFHQGRYTTLSHGELQAKLASFVRDEFQRTNATTRDGQMIQVTRGVLGNVSQALAGITLVESHLDQPIWLGNDCSGPYFAFENGLIGVTGLLESHCLNLTPHCSQWFAQTAFPYRYEQAATCPQWLSFLGEVLEHDEERLALVQQWFGYCLTPNTSRQRFVVAIGDGENGKSVMLDVLAELLGPDNVSHVPVELFAQRFQLTMTLGKLANISYDTGEIDHSAEATIKEFTGGDRMYFDRKGIPGVMAKPSARLILATNHEPRFADRTKGIWRRMIVLPFRISIPRDRQDPHLTHKLKRELPGIFNWAVEGLRRLAREGQFIVPALSQAAWEEFKRESNPARQFLAERYVTSREAVGCADLYREYVEWCREGGLKALDVTNFGKELRKLFPSVERRRSSTGERLWSYHGLAKAGRETAHAIADLSGADDAAH